MPLIMPNFIALGQDEREKALQCFKHFSILTPQEDSLGPLGSKFTNLVANVQQDPSMNLPNFVPF